jgi:hypothetical protein
MVDKGLRKFPPLAAGHPAVGTLCGICQRAIETGDETTLIPKEAPPADGRAHTVEAALCHWVCVTEALRLADGQPMRNAWTPPPGAVEPVNHFHALYMRLAQINEGLLREAPKVPGVLEQPVFGELLGSCADLGNKTAELTRMLDGIRRDFPHIWEVWLASTGDM